MIDPRSLCQLEIQTSDVEKSLRFFSEVFGWPVLPIMIQDLYVLDVPESSPYGISLVPRRSDAPPCEGGIVPYFRMDQSWEIMEAKATALGAKIVEGPRVVPAYGKVLKLKVPGEVLVGLFFPAPSHILQSVE